MWAFQLHFPFFFFRLTYVIVWTYEMYDSRAFLYLSRLLVTCTHVWYDGSHKGATWKTSKRYDFYENVLSSMDPIYHRKEAKLSHYLQNINRRPFLPRTIGFLNKRQWDFATSPQILFRTSHSTIISYLPLIMIYSQTSLRLCHILKGAVVVTLCQNEAEV